MKTTSCGADPKFNFNAGQIRDVSIDEARYWFDLRLCELIDEFPKSEKAVVKPAEKAVVKPEEKAVVAPIEKAIAWK